MTNPGEMSCAEFQAHLPELIGSGQDLSNNPHLRECELCSALLADLQTIADAARQLFPPEEPSSDIWEKIESALKDESGDKAESLPRPKSPA